MAEEAQRKLQSALDTSLDGIDKDSLRPIQKRAYLCMSKCFDNTRASQSQLAACQDQCGAPLQRVQQVIDAELNELQGRVQRCAAACADEARDMVPPGAGAQSPEVLKAQDKLDDCVKGCAERSLKSISQLESRIKAAVASS